MKRRPDPSTTVGEYLEILSRHRRLIIVVAVLAVLVAVVGSLLQPVRYESTARLSFNDSSTDIGLIGVAVAPNQQPEKLAAAQSELITRLTTAQVVKRELRTSLTPQQLRDRITVSVDTQSNLVDVLASAPRKNDAALIANAFAQTTLDIVTRNERRRYAAAAADLQAKSSSSTREGAAASADNAYGAAIARLRSLQTFARPVSIASVAAVPDSPAAPKPVRNAVLGLFVGLIVAIGLAILRDRADARVRSIDQLRKLLPLPQLGSIKESAMGSAGGTRGEDIIDASDLESFRILRQNVSFLEGDEDASTIVVTSAKPGEGKSTVAAAIAYTSALAGTLTLLVEADLRRPSLSKRFGTAASPGLADFLRGQAEPEDILRPLSVSTGRSGPGAGVDGSLVFIPAGEGADDVAELLAGPAFEAFLRQVGDVYDLVVIDTSPILPVVDTMEIVPYADALVLCVRAEQTTEDEVLAAHAALSNATTDNVGIVFTGVPERAAGAYGYYAYGYGTDVPA